MALSLCAFFQTQSSFASVRIFQSVSALTDDKSRESNALQTNILINFVCIQLFFVPVALFSLSPVEQMYRKPFMPTTSKHTSDSSFVLIHSKYVNICIVNSTCVLSTVHAIKHTICFRDKFDHTHGSTLKTSFQF